ncbi:indolepyruvate oxidoreductase subunit beta family protein [soil metagenome]
MNVHNPQSEAIIKLAILAVGGQGGGVISDWIVAVAERNGWYAQSTSVPGVAQRTGATIYYIEMVPAFLRTPVLALMPAPGDVDIVIASELMEAGRAILRGLVTPARTTLIYSTHRAYAVSEKIQPGDGISDPDLVIAAARTSSRAVFSGDFESIAARSGSVISASLLGALAASGTLPFPRESFEQAIRGGGKGIDQSLAAFAGGFTAAAVPPAAKAPEPVAILPAIPERFARRIERDYPVRVRDMLQAGLAKVLDYQGKAYGETYLERVTGLLRGDSESRGNVLTREGAKYIANAMCYDDIIRVADRKTRLARLARVCGEVKAGEDQVLEITEYFHPRMEEVCGLLPAPLGAFIQRRPRLFKMLDRMVSHGRRIRTDSLRGFLLLYITAGLRFTRRISLRHRIEKAHLQAWLGEAMRLAPTHYDLAVEVIRTRRLVKGYSDTHARGLSRFDLVMGTIPVLEHRDDAADWLRRLREAALRDEDGTMLKGALRTIASL